MSNPRPEHRITAVEKRTTRIEGLIEEMASDTAEELKVIHQDIKQLEDGIMSSFKKIGDTFIDTVANKEDLTAMEGRINTRLNKVDSNISELKNDISRLESDITSIKTTQEQILKLLQQK